MNLHVLRSQEFEKAIFNKNRGYSVFFFSATSVGEADCNETFQDEWHCFQNRLLLQLHSELETVSFNLVCLIVVNSLMSHE